MRPHLSLVIKIGGAWRGLPVGQGALLPVKRDAGPTCAYFGTRTRKGQKRLAAERRHAIARNAAPTRLAACLPNMTRHGAAGRGTDTAAQSVDGIAHGADGEGAVRRTSVGTYIAVAQCAWTTFNHAYCTNDVSVRTNRSSNNAWAVKRYCGHSVSQRLGCSMLPMRRCDMSQILWCGGTTIFGDQDVPVRIPNRCIRLVQTNARSRCVVSVDGDTPNVS